ncbi:MAG: hypothetical protein ACUVR1_08060 [Fimbriimonadales bacterium]
MMRGNARWGAVALLMALVLVLSACQRQESPRVRVDFARAAQAVGMAPAPTLSAQLPAQGGIAAPDAAFLPRLEAPAPTEAIRRRRTLALESIEQQRAAVRDRLLQARLQGLSELEARWAAELRAEYAFDALRAARDATWREAFEAYGRARFPLLVALIFTAPESDARREAQARLDAHDRAWHAREQAIERDYQAQLQRIEQEIAVRVNARRRAFVRTAEQEIQAQIAAQPDPATLYLLPPQTPPPAPARKETIPPLRVNMPARDLHKAPRAQLAAAKSLRQVILRQLANEWAQANGYTLTDDPHAPDRTDAFVRYLLAK